MKFWNCKIINYEIIKSNSEIIKSNSEIKFWNQIMKSNYEIINYEILKL